MLRRLVRPLAPALALALAGVVAPACGGDEETGDSGEQITGTPCTKNAQCGPLGWCMTNESVEEVSEGDIVVNIPGGYCSQLNCRKGYGEEVCGENSYCFDLKQYLPDNPIGLCGKICSSEADCRDGYLCHDGSLTTDGQVIFKPLPHKACLPPALLCLLDIANPDCPDAAPVFDAGGGKDAGADASQSGDGG